MTACPKCESQNTHRGPESWGCLVCGHEWRGGSTVIENYVPPDTGWGIVVGRFMEPPAKDKQP
jgi:ribosomal protein L37AE/L43A